MFLQLIKTILLSQQHIPQCSHHRQMIHTIWQVQGYTPFQEEHILPKGVVEIVFNLNGGTLFARIGNQPFQIHQAFINGFNTVPIHFQLPEQLHLFGVQLQPFAIKKLLKIPACTFSNAVTDLSLVHKTFDSLWQQLAEQPAFEQRVAVLLKWIDARIIEPDTREAWINRFLSHTKPSSLSVGELARTVCYSTRQLSRKLQEATGMNTEELLLYKKYLHAVQLMHDTDLPLTEIAYESHFSDQSHFIRSFKTFTHLTPSAYRTGKSPLKGHLYEHVR